MTALKWRRMMRISNGQDFCDCFSLWRLSFCYFSCCPILLLPILLIYMWWLSVLCLLPIFWQLVLCHPSNGHDLLAFCHLNFIRLFFFFLIWEFDFIIFCLILTYFVRLLLKWPSERSQFINKISEWFDENCRCKCHCAIA